MSINISEQLHNKFVSKYIVVFTWESPDIPSSLSVAIARTPTTIVACSTLPTLIFSILSINELLYYRTRTKVSKNGTYVILFWLFCCYRIMQWITSKKHPTYVSFPQFNKLTDWAPSESPAAESRAKAICIALSISPLANRLSSWPWDSIIFEYLGGVTWRRKISNTNSFFLRRFSPK